MTTIAAAARAAAFSPETSPEPASLLSPYHLGGLRLGNRMVLSPMTRSRAITGNVPNPIAPQYYAQRASAGLQITEGTQVSPQGVGYIRTPGMHSAEQVAGWKRVTDAVHAAGGTMGVWSHYRDEQSIYRGDHREHPPWTLDELDRLVHRHLLGGPNAG